ncbi:MAG: hypothetical protein WC497_04410 [Patescibacteria group bacterium]
MRIKRIFSTITKVIIWSFVIVVLFYIMIKFAIPDLKTWLDVLIKYLLIILSVIAYVWSSFQLGWNIKYDWTEENNKSLRSRLLLTGKIIFTMCYMGLIVSIPLFLFGACVGNEGEMPVCFGGQLNIYFIFIIAVIIIELGFYANGKKE